MNKKLIDLIKREFEKKLQVKTGWGKNEVLTLFLETVNESVLTILDEEQTTN